ncbi:ATP-binding cassette sub-family C member 10 [Dermacentor andersoni]|uniref:ATP-binding cassette sub-family C member 10 n=1 Tax=Dermacentor andersoni TaxID=34620 RepID=UPI00215540C9|nr:ATP-binding cassette sub-family C member 10-like [Dermacentor andersoni]
MNLWDTICAAKDGTLVIWEGNHLSRCFLDLLASGVHALVAVISVYYAGARQIALRREHQLVHLLPSTWRTHLRKLCCSILLLRPVIHLIMSQLILGEFMAPSTMLHIGAVILAWTVHFFYLQTLTNPLPRHRRFVGEVPVIFAVTTSGLCATFRVSALLSLSESERGSELSFQADLYANVASALACAFYLTAAVHCSSTAVETPPRTPGRESPSSVHSYVRLLEADDDARQLGTAEDTNIFSLLTFWWVGRLMRRGYRGHIQEPDDLHDLPVSLRPGEVIRGLYRKVDTSGSLPSLLVLFHRCVGQQYYAIGVLKFLADVLSFASPVLLNRLVMFLEEGPGQGPAWSGYAYASGLALACLLGAFMSAHYSYLVSRVGLKARAIVVALVYQKTLRADATELRKSSSEALNLVTTDADRIVNLFGSFHEAWSLPLQVAVTMFLLWQQIGLAFLAGVVVAVSLVPVNRSIALNIGRLSTGMMAFKDERIKLMSEVLWGMRMIKMHAWEALFQERVESIRKKEVVFLRQRKYLDALCVFFWVVTPVLMSVLSFVTYVLLGHRLTAAKVFTCLALFNLLKVPLNAFPWVINGCMEAWVSLKRTQCFLNLQDFAPAGYYTTSKDDDQLVRVTNGVFHWGGLTGDATLPVAISGAQGRNFILGPVNVTLRKGQLVGVVGRVGSGKSTLLAAITGDICRVQGTVTLQRLDMALGLVPQQPWLQRGTVRANVLFGRPFDATRYQATLECCALLDDLKSLPAGDLTEVGEEGQTLSGGQKRRVALARALYQDCDVYLLDDPLSALDAHVAQQVFERCIVGAMRGKARLLCTHQVGFLAQADHVIVLRDGKVVAEGPPSTVLKSSVIEALPELAASEEPSLPKTSSSSSAAKSSHEASSAMFQESSRMLVEEEEREFGAVRLSTVRSYWDAVGAWLAATVLLSLILMQVSRTSTDWWLAVWVSWANTTKNVQNHRLIRDTNSDVMNVFLPIYGGLAVANGFLTLARAFSFAYGGVVAAVKVHDLLLDKVLKAPLSFLEATPVGRVLNRFSTDVWSIDDTLPFMLNIVLAQSVALAGTLVVTSYGLPWVLLLLIPLAFAYNSLQQYYRWTSRELRRLGSITLSPVYSHFTETFAGLSVIRSFKAVSRFCQENLHKLAVNQQAVFASQAASQWLNLRLQLMGVLLTSGVAFLAVVQHQVRGVSAGFVGLALSYALSITSLLSSLVTSFTDTEKEMVSMERADQYIKGLEEERLDGGILPPFGWPFCGAVKFSKVTLRYRPGLPAALSGISFEAAKGSKVGIVGRTGAGKSSLLQALFRLTPVESGQIYIDGVDVLRMHPKEVRSRLAAIPQDPFVFSGSVRDNVDPRGLHSDAQIWQALDRCQLGRTIRSLRNSSAGAGTGLEASLGPRGSLLSTGQRQLLALARALLYKARVLCLDEATAGIDAETDCAIQETIRSTFQDTTILVIAHRVETVLDCDQVLVMSHGKVIESGIPRELLRIGNGHFRALVEASRKNGGTVLIETAEADDNDVPLIGFSDP